MTEVFKMNVSSHQGVALKLGGPRITSVPELAVTLSWVKY